MIEQLSALFETEQPIFFLLAGPNGAGKSTFRRCYLTPADLACIDPDEVARTLYGRDPKSKEEARSATIESTRQANALFATRESFGLETVFSDEKGLKLELLSAAKAHGYRAGVIFVGVDDAQLSIARVAGRADEGGHDVPDELILQRFPRSFQNLKQAIPIADFVLLVDNSREARHRIFGLVTPERGIHLWDRTPRWYNDFEIGKALPRCIP